jgi:hypothetical protein
MAFLADYGGSLNIELNRCAVSLDSIWSLCSLPRKNGNVLRRSGCGDE